MAFREVPVFEVREVLRLWLRGEGPRPIERLSGVNRKTVRRYVDAAVVLGLRQDGGEVQLTDVFLGSVVEAVRPHRGDGHGEAWRVLAGHHDRIQAWLDEGLTAVKVGELLTREGILVPERTLHRYTLEECGHGRRPKTTVRVADGEPGDELQVDFGRMGLLFDPEADRNRVCQALIFTACYSRHTFVWLTFRQTTADVIDGFEAAWAFFGGVFATVVPDNMGTVVDKANPTEPRFNQAFIEYAQARGFVVDAARVRSPQDKPRVERTVPFVRNSFFAGETFIDLADATTPGHGVVPGAGGDADPWHDPGAAGRVVRGGRSPGVDASAGRALRPADLRDGQGAPRSPHRSRPGAVFGSRESDRDSRRRPRRPGVGEGVLAWPARQGPSPDQAGRAGHRRG